MPDADADLIERVAQLERRFRIALATAVICLASGVLALFGAISAGAAAAPVVTTNAQISDVLRVRELNIVDAKGVTRVKIGSPLPTAVVNGQRNKTRGGRPEDTMSGMLLFDAEGVERSGYATVDHGYPNVLLTLDDKEKQHAMFIAEPTGATTLRLFNADTKDRIDVAIDKDGPSISMVRRGKETFRLPSK